MHYCQSGYSEIIILHGADARFATDIGRDFMQISAAFVMIHFGRLERRAVASPQHEATLHVSGLQIVVNCLGKEQ